MRNSLRLFSGTCRYAGALVRPESSEAGSRFQLTPPVVGTPVGWENLRAHFAYRPEVVSDRPHHHSGELADRPHQFWHMLHLDLGISPHTYLVRVGMAQGLMVFECERVRMWI